MENKVNENRNKVINLLFKFFTIVIFLFISFSMILSCQKDINKQNDNINSEEAENTEQIVEGVTYDKEYQKDLKIGDDLVKVLSDNIDFVVEKDTLVGDLKGDMNIEEISLNFGN